MSGDDAEDTLRPAVEKLIVRSFRKILERTTLLELAFLVIIGITLGSVVTWFFKEALNGSQKESIQLKEETITLYKGLYEKYEKDYNEKNEEYNKEKEKLDSLNDKFNDLKTHYLSEINLMSEKEKEMAANYEKTIDDLQSKIKEINKKKTLSPEDALLDELSALDTSGDGIQANTALTFSDGEYILKADDSCALTLSDKSSKSKQQTQKFSVGQTQFLFFGGKRYRAVFKFKGGPPASDDDKNPSEDFCYFKFFQP